MSYNAITPGTRYYRGHFTRISHTELLLIITVASRRPDSESDVGVKYLSGS